LLWLENRLLFPGTKAEIGWNRPPAGVAVADVSLTAADGTRLHAWWSEPPHWQPRDGALLLCHGNGGNLSHRGWYLAFPQRFLGVATLLIDYPGYGRCDGTPTEAGCYAAADAAYDWLTTDRGVPAARIVLYGGSIGGGVASDLAARRPHRALVLVCAFTSFPDEAQWLYPWLPGRWFVRNRFDTIAKITSIGGPVFIAHSRHDQLIPYAMGLRLFEAARGPKRFFTMERQLHTDLLEADALAALSEFLTQSSLSSE